MTTYRFQDHDVVCDDTGRQVVVVYADGSLVIIKPGDDEFARLSGFESGWEFLCRLETTRSAMTELLRTTRLKVSDEDARSVLLFTMDSRIITSAVVRMTEAMKLQKPCHLKFELPTYVKAKQVN